MWWHNQRTDDGRRTTELSRLSSVICRLSSVICLAAFTAGCFQPLYGERSFTGGPGLRSALAAVDVAEISAPPGTPLARMAVELRNELNFELNGGAGPLPPKHRLVINLSTSGQTLIVDPSTARPEFEVTAANAFFTLTDLATSKPAMTGNVTARTSYDIPGQQQRYAALRGQRDSQSRAAKLLAEQIRTRLASHFAAGS